MSQVGLHPLTRLTRLKLVGGYSSKLIFFDGLFVLTARALLPGFRMLLDHPIWDFHGYMGTLKNLNFLPTEYLKLVRILWFEKYIIKLSFSKTLPKLFSALKHSKNARKVQKRA